MYYFKIYDKKNYSILTNVIYCINLEECILYFNIFENFNIEFQIKYMYCVHYKFAVNSEYHDSMLIYKNY